MGMRAVVIHDEVKFDLAGKLLIEAVEELDELLMAMACIALADDLALCDVQSGEKRGGGVALVIMGHCPASALFERQARLGAAVFMVTSKWMKNGLLGGGLRKDLGGLREGTDRWQTNQPRGMAPPTSKWGQGQATGAMCIFLQLFAWSFRNGDAVGRRSSWTMTTVNQNWIAEKLAMKSAANVSLALHRAMKTSALAEEQP